FMRLNSRIRTTRSGGRSRSRAGRVRRKTHSYAAITSTSATSLLGNTHLRASTSSAPFDSLRSLTVVRYLTMTNTRLDKLGAVRLAALAHGRSIPHDGKHPPRQARRRSIPHDDTRYRTKTKSY